MVPPPKQPKSKRAIGAPARPFFDVWPHDKGGVYLFPFAEETSIKLRGLRTELINSIGGKVVEDVKSAEFIEVPKGPDMNRLRNCTVPGQVLVNSYWVNEMRSRKRWIDPIKENFHFEIVDESSQQSADTLWNQSPDPGVRRSKKIRMENSPDRGIEITDKIGRTLLTNELMRLSALRLTQQKRDRELRSAHYANAAANIESTYAHVTDVSFDDVCTVVKGRTMRERIQEFFNNQRINDRNETDGEESE